MTIVLLQTLRISFCSPHLHQINAFQLELSIVVLLYSYIISKNYHPRKDEISTYIQRLSSSLSRFEVTFVDSFEFLKKSFLFLWSSIQSDAYLRRSKIRDLKEASSAGGYDFSKCAKINRDMLSYNVAM